MTFRSLARTFVSLGASLVALAAPALAQRAPAARADSAPPPLTRPLPTDPAVRIGTLPNGLRYYIRRNGKPEKRAELRLVVNAGSVLEDSAQLGLAHFVEHTAFNGTTHFRRNDLVSYLESIGVRFGADLNASTGFDETVYILPVPTDSARIVERAFDILEDWAHGQTFDSSAVVGERGVVLEEWRGRKGAGERLMRQWLPIAFQGSRYAERLPIGTPESIEGATPSRLRRFYREWYRPDLMAVVAVGDFDPTRIERLVRQHFAGVRNPPHETPRPQPGVPDNAAPLVAIAADPEATSTSVQVLYKLPHLTTRTVGDYRRELAEQLYLGALDARLDEIAQRPDAPFLNAGVGKGSFIARTRDAFSLSAAVKEGGVERGLEALLLEAKRADRYGFLPSELTREKADLMRAYERAYAERDKTQSAAFVDEYVQNYLEGDAIPGIAREYDLVRRLLPGITLAEVNALGRRWIGDSNRVVVVQGPRRAEAPLPTREQVLAVFDRAAAAPVTAWAETLSDAPLVGALPAPGRVTATRTNAAVGVTEWRLANGARVLVKPTDFKADEVLFSAWAPGGLSLAPDSLLMSANFAAQVVALGGLGNFNRVDLGKRLSGKAVRLSPYIDETSQGLNGSASPKDLETLLQLAYLHFTAPRLDSAAWLAFRNQVAPFLANRGTVPEQVFADTVAVTMAQHSPRAQPLTPATFAQVDPTRAFDFYRARFGDASGFTFLVVGNVTLDSLRPLVERYLGALPAAGRQEAWRDVAPQPPAGIVERTVRKGTEPKAQTMIAFTGPFEYTPENRFAVRALVSTLQIELNETLREKLGGTYSPSVGGGGSRAPEPRYDVRVAYGSSPENVDTLKKTVFALVDALRANGPPAAEVEKVREQLLRGREVELKLNAYWLGNIAGRDQAGEPLEGLLAPYDAMVRGLTAQQIRDAARRYFDPSRVATFVLLPEAR